MEGGLINPPKDIPGVLIRTTEICFNGGGINQSPEGTEASAVAAVEGASMEGGLINPPKCLYLHSHTIEQTASMEGGLINPPKTNS